MTPETDSRLSIAWISWTVARQETDQIWRRAALNALYQAVMRAMDEEGNGVEAAGATIPFI